MEKFPMNVVFIYKSVDNKSLSWDISQKPTENRIHARKGEWIYIVIAQKNNWWIKEYLMYKYLVSCVRLSYFCWWK